MKLARFIQRKMEHLLEGWEEAALDIAPELEGADSKVLRDHAEVMLKFITEDLMTSQSPKESARKALGRGSASGSFGGDRHGIERLEQGLSLLQVIQELRALRARVIEFWSDEQQGLDATDIDELVRFNEAIDQMIIGSVSSYSARKEHENRLFEAMLKASPDPAAIFDTDGKLMFLNTPMADLVSTPLHEASGKTPLELGLGFAVELQEAVTATVATGQAQRRELHCRLPSGRELYFDCQLVPVLDNHSDIEAVATTSRDITERKQAEQQVWRSANLDSLTGLPNRRLFIDRLEQSRLEASRKQGRFALLFIDLDRFKQANDQLGHMAGDRLLKKVADRISTSVRAMDTVARLGGDEFTVILKDAGPEDARKAAEALLESLEGAFDVDSHRLYISGSIGLTLFPDDGEAADQLMHNADQAMYAAKARGGHQIRFYRPSMSRNESEHMQLNRELEEGFRRQQLEIHYQPIVDIRTGTIVRAEALLRWNHPDKGMLAPASFLAVAEQSGMADRINAFVLEQAVTSSLQWRDRNGDTFPININESPSSFFTRTLVDQWRARLSSSSVEASRITVELSPASLTNIRASGLDPISSLGLPGLGLCLAVDNFGIEPFSLVALEEFQVASIKMERALIREIGQNGGGAEQVIKAIISMAHTMNVRVVAEGVETDQQLEFLAQAGCDFGQGFLFQPPLPREHFEKLLARDGR